MTWLRSATAWLRGGMARIARNELDSARSRLPTSMDAASPSETGAAETTAAPSPIGTAPPAPTATGVPDEREEGRAVRVFLSSTFRDMQAERDELARTTFPALQRRFRERGVELLGVDLRWGVTEADVTLEVCLAEVERCKPWFVGLLGQRYGTVLTDREATSELKEAFAVVRDGAGRSLTEIEILHGVLADPENAQHALFFERDPAWLDTLGADERADFEEPPGEARDRLADLRSRIGAVASVVSYAAPADIGVAVEAALGALLDARHPEAEARDAFTRTHRLHAAYARDRLGVYVGGEPWLERLDRWMAEPGAAPVLIAGASGGGKSALIAHWLQAWRSRHPRDILFAHYIGASPDSADPMGLMRRLWEHLNRATGETVEPPAGNVGLMDMAAELAQRLAQAALQAQRQGASIVIALDGLDRLSREQDLRWLPSVPAPNVRLLGSSLDGEAKDAVLARGWSTLEVAPLDDAGKRQLVAVMLQSWGKRDLPPARLKRILAHPLSGLPLFLRTVLEELRVSATEAVLDARLGDYLAASDMPGLFARVLTRLERDCGEDLVRRALSLVWAGRAGLEEAEVVAMTGATPLAWARLRNALGDALRDQAGRIAFGHDFLRDAVGARYLPAAQAQRDAHLALADRLEARDADARQAEELPYQLLRAQAWDRLETLLLDLDRFELQRERGDAELLGYWLALPEGRGDPGRRLCERFELRTGAPDRWRHADIGPASAIGAFLHFAGAVGDGPRRLAERLCRACERLLSPDHLTTLASMGNLAALLHASGDLKAAQRLAEGVVAALARSMGPEYAGTLTTMSTLAATLRARGDLAGALKVAESMVEATTRRFGPEHRQTLIGMNGLAQILRDRGDLEGAQKLQERVLEAMTRTLGPEHSDTLTSMSNLALILQARGDLDRAQELGERAMQTRTRVLGAEHPLTLTSMSNLALTLHARGDLDGAQELVERAFDGRARVLGPEHPETLFSMANLAATLCARGDLDRALEVGRHVLEARTRVLGPEHPDTLTSQNNLATILQDRGDLAAAQELLERALEVSARVLDPEHPSTLTSMINLSITRHARGDVDGAQRLLERVLEAREGRLGPRHPDTRASMRDLALFLHVRGDAAGAQALWHRMLSPEQPPTTAAAEAAARADTAPARTKRRIRRRSSTQLDRDLTEWRERWLGIGVCTQPADRSRVEYAIDALYAAMGRAAPRFVWTPSPAAALAEALYHALEVAPKGSRPEDRLRDTLGGPAIDALWDPLRASLDATLHASIEDAIGERVHHALWEPIEDAIEGGLFNPLRDRLLDMLQAGDPRVQPLAADGSAHPLSAELGDLLLKTSGRFSAMAGLDGKAPWRLHWAFAGQHDVHWIAFYRFCEHVLGVRYEPEQSRRLGLWADLCEGGWWAPYYTWCICVDKPATLHMEPIGDPRQPGRATERLHGVNGPAVEFRDGFALHATHRVR